LQNPQILVADALGGSRPINDRGHHCETKSFFLSITARLISTHQIPRSSQDQLQPFRMADSTPKSYSTDPALYLYTSLTSGSSHIVTATSRMETILKANRIPFKALDIATDEKARMLWGRRAGKDESGRARKIPGLVQMGLVIGVCAPCCGYISWN
jgi:hypothetical protein